MVRHRSRLVVVTCALLMFASACSANYPTTPDRAPVALSIQRPFGGVVQGSEPLLAAFAVADDGVYQDVTERATWTTSDPNVVRVVPAGSSVVRAIRLTPGDAQVVASYGGVVDRVPMPAVYTNRPGPFLEIQVPRVALQPPDPSDGAVRVVLHELFFSQRNPAVPATLTSSNPAVAAVDGDRVRAIGPGTFVLTASYGSLTEWALVSIPPRTQLATRP